MLIGKCIDTINNQFKDNWIKEFYTTDETSTTVIDTILLYSKLNNFSDDFFLNLNLSLIAGEYVGIEDFGKHLNEIEDLISKKLEETFTYSSSKDFELIYYSIIVNQLFLPIQNALNHYKQFYKRISGKLIEPNRTFILDIFQENYDITNETVFLQTKKRRDFFVNYNILLAKYDHELLVSKEALSALLDIHLKLLKSEFDTGIINKLLFYKANYLILKVIDRGKQSTDNLSFTVDFEIKELSYDHFPAGPYDSFINNMRLHYSDEIDGVHKRDFDAKIRKLIAEYADDKLTLYESFHAFVKYYKDDNVNEQKLNDIINQFVKNQRKSRNSNLDFDRRAYYITLNYLHNNFFSFCIEKKDLTLEELSSQLKKIESLQNDTSVKNYFPFLKACTYLSKIIEFEFEKDDIDFKFIRKALEIYKDSTKVLQINFLWCFERSFIAFQSSYDESVTIGDIENKGVKVFSNTSLALPLNYEVDRKNVQQVVRDLQKFTILRDVREEVYNDKERINKIKNDFLKQDKKNIEILGIFAAIVLFVASDIQLFTKISSTEQALKFMLVFGYVIGLFIILIWLVTRDNILEINKIPRTHKWIVGIWIVWTIVAFYLASPFSDKRQMESVSVESLSRISTGNIFRVQQQRDSLNRIIEIYNKIKKIDSSAKSNVKK